MRTPVAFLLLAMTSLLSVLYSNAQPQPVVWPSNYHVTGVVTLPYAELTEPFETWYDANLGKSRSDFYNGLYQVYQFGPNSSPNNKHGVLYKFAWVPNSFRPQYVEGAPKKQQQQNQGLYDEWMTLVNKHKFDMGHLMRSVRDQGPNMSNNKQARLDQTNDNSLQKTKTRRACFQVNGSEVGSIGPQTVLPSLASFTFSKIEGCPPHKMHKCELWTYSSSFGDKRSEYKMWIRRDQETNGLPVPVMYFMEGYDSLLGSHFDRYYFSYINYKANGAHPTNFEFQNKDIKCESMPGPGDDDDSSTPSASATRSNLITQNPLHEFMTDPHRYDHVDHEFDKFKQTHNKNYNSPVHHKSAWMNILHNIRFINIHNRRQEDFKLKVNQFADTNLNELKYLRGRFKTSKGYNGGLSYEKHVLKGGPITKDGSIPPSWDWRLLGAVTPVKDQAICGSCWSFGTSGTIEGAYFVQTGKLVRLSQQQMIDCSWAYGNNGCDGGEDYRAYKYIQDAGGLASEEDYGRYMGVDGRCHDKDVNKTVKLLGFYNITQNNEVILKDALLKYGPVTVGIDASQPTFTFYSHGIYYDEKCNNKPEGLDHQVLVVGYGNLNGQDYWLVKNSWSTYWGNDGYILMSSKNNNCGVMTAPTVPIVRSA